MQIPTFTIFDADGNVTDANKCPRHETDNKRLLTLLGQPNHDTFPAVISWNDNFVVWPNALGDAVMEDYDTAEWRKWCEEVEQAMGQVSGLNKNMLFVGHLLTKAWEAGKPSKTLRTLCERILAFAEKA